MSEHHHFAKPIQLYSCGTPNGEKVHIYLEEAGIPFEQHIINIRIGEQLTPEFIAINPNNRIPAIVDPNTDLKVFESAAILIYLAEKTGKFLPPVSEPKKRYEVLEWVMWQMGGVGPMMGQFNHFNSRDEKIQYAIDRYTNESFRLLRVLNSQLQGKEYVAAGEYSIADICLWPWVKLFTGKFKEESDKLTHVKAWVERIGEREGVQRGLKVCKIDSLPDPKGFGTFQKPTDFVEVGIYDLTKQRELELARQKANQGT